MKKSFFVLAFILFFPFVSFSQSACPSVTPGPNPSICNGCTNITATVQGTVATTSYSVSQITYNPQPYAGTPILIGIDDQFSDTIQLPFCFEFYGNTYTKCVVGSNGIINFDATNANNYNTWPISAPVPTNNPPDLTNSVMGPWQDIDPSVGGNIYYQLSGTAPCRKLVVSWDSVPYFDCNDTIAWQQIVLYETTNIIDVYIRYKGSCPSWNSDAAIEAIQDPTGTQAVVVPGRNYPTVWTTSNDAWRFTPTGAPQYTFQWLDPNNNVVGTTDTVSVCPTSTTTYTAQVINNTCNGPITLTAQVTVGLGVLPVTVTASASCGVNSGVATATPSGGNTPYTYTWSNGQSTQTATGLGAGTYTVTVVANGGCSGSATVSVASQLGVAAGIQSTSSPLCFGVCGGSATATQTGGTTPYTYVWNNGQSAQTATGLCAGNYTVTITDNNGCTSTAQATVTQPPQITALVSVVPCTMNQANAAATASGGGGATPYSYFWLTTPVQFTQTITGLSPGTYTVIVVDNNNCSDTITAIVDICPPDSLFIPNVFTPNGDNSNDQFFIYTEGYKNLHVDIYDRWGLLIYTWDDITKGWNGRTKNGSNAPSGTYYFVMTGEKLSGETKEEKGFLQLLREK